MPPSRPLIDRFWEKVERRGPDKCWVWTGSSTKKKRGYGQIAKGAPARGMFYAHRVSYELHNGPIPVGEGYHGTCVCHTCDNPPCVNPRHLFLGTFQDDMDDRKEKGRQSKGEGRPTAKLTERKVVEILRDYIRGSQTHGQLALARKHGVGRATIGRVVRGESWK